MGTHRIERLQEQILQRVSQILIFEVEDPRVRDVTVTRVVLTRDMGFARIYYETTNLQSRVMLSEGLANVAGFVRVSLAKALRLRVAPQIEFFYDETREEVEKVEKLFAKL